MNVRRSAAVLAAVAVLGAAAPAAADSSPSPKQPALPSALYGDGDPQYDGVWRQSLALLAQHAAGVEPPKAAVGWLAGQQCDDGSFAPFRADPSAACDAKTMVDTNQTAAAVQALAALGGHDAVTEKAVGWLKSVQNKDGGWGYTAGGPSDTNSTSVVVGALAAVGEKPGEVKKGGKSPYDALLGLELPCTGEGAGAFAYQPEKDGSLTANADATAAGVLGALGKGLLVEPGKGDGPGSCVKATTPEQAAANGAAHLADALAAKGYLLASTPGAEDQPDVGNTADAVVALAAQGDTAQAEKSYAWLEKNAGDWAAQSGPGAYAQLILASHATGADPRDFGGTDLVKQLQAAGPAAPRKATEATEATAKAEDEEESDSPFGVWWFVGVCLVAGIGIGFLISNRAKRQQP
ncbi:prenyltransferase/squalene oxidase repeat-containing protein [Streptomyces sp. DSM 41972]|uniref:Prenyltransferase/squalene oxidase repeat-containing protein n=1 Tax=Streptomyces althioticus subsp. attaecolombicae TaxID=3075534 RepID=A0ABU3HZM8_9ACTN|nr:prenyltransferase/squalene oxidase repeat-containing protein [Streptomyces sp. DSM 41972]SCD27603.1 Prenyltransferase and squalene oxidase repeat-containing protein [Streptomyces sp. di188]SCD59984.1 Prenyltransferase and squalene oxidase repeat-containing protein [Streptomyces sp. di50b]